MNTLKIGWASRDVSTDMHLNMPGQFHLRIGKGSLDPITVTALVVDNGEDLVIFLSADMIDCRCHLFDEVREKIRTQRAHIPEEKRTAQFVSVVACVFPDGRYFTVRGESQGLILTEGIGCGGFGYDPLFYQIEIKKTFAQASPEEKNFISHRGRAMVKFCEQIKSYL